MMHSGRFRQTRWRNRALLALCLALALPAGGCVYRINIQQGNYLDPAALEQLQVGMTRSQVRYLLGTPMVPDAFNNDRWDYLFYFKRGRLRDPEERKVTVFFEDDKVARFDRGSGPSSQVATAEPKDPPKELPPEEPPPKEMPQTQPPQGEPLAQEPTN
jgi:outer membrane protein assembly factor BamE